MKENTLQENETAEEYFRRTSPQVTERRTTQRTSIEAEVGLHSETNFYTGFSEDISTGGIFIATYNLKAIGARLQVSFSLPGGDRVIDAYGVVRWVREFNETEPDVTPGMGVQFETLSQEDHDAIHEFVEERPTMFYTA